MSDFAFLVAQLPEAVANTYSAPEALISGEGNNGARLAHERAMATRAMILDLIEQHPGLGVCEVADRLNISRQTANKNLRMLRRDGQIHRLPGYFGGYSITTTCKKY